MNFLNSYEGFNPKKMLCVAKKLSCSFLFILMALLTCSFSDADFELFKKAVNLCTKDNDEAAFIFSKSLLKRPGVDVETAQALKEVMVFCNISNKSKYHDELIKISNEVIQTSSSFLSIGISWYNKGLDYALRGGKEEAVNCFRISIKILEEVPYSADEGNISFRRIYEFYCHSFLATIYTDLGDEEKLNIENEIIEDIKANWNSNCVIKKI